LSRRLSNHMTPIAARYVKVNAEGTGAAWGRAGISEDRSAIRDAKAGRSFAIWTKAGHTSRAPQCQLSAVKRTSSGDPSMSAYDPKRPSRRSWQ
jgi:hypothetical protein